MAVKVDLKKVYNNLYWELIDDILIVAEFPNRLRSIIMDCITTPTAQVLLNGEPEEMFVMGRGIRQGCPPLPHLFVRCIERLDHLICDLLQ